MLIDTHCHLYFDEIKNDLENVFLRAKELGVTKFVCVGTNISDSKMSLDLSREYKHVYATAGIHPHDSKDVELGYLNELREILSNNKVVAVGEIGLDYFRNISTPEVQQKVFIEQLELSLEIKKPIVFHNRESDTDLINILSDFSKINGVAHCFSSSLNTAEKLIDMGFYISFSGNLTFKNSHLPDIAKKLPLDRLLVETDTPFLSPVPHRGKTNEPGRARFVAEKLAEIFNSDVENIASITTQNARSVFNL